MYFLTEVSEKDLMNFTLSDSVTLPEVDTVYAEPEKQAEEDDSAEPTETPEKEEEEVQMPEEKSSVGTYLLIGIIVVGVAGAGWYFKVYKQSTNTMMKMRWKTMKMSRKILRQKKEKLMMQMNSKSQNRRF